MDPLTLELFRCLQSEPYDESGLQRIRGLLSKQRRALAGQGDVAMLGEIVHLLEDWALAAADARVGVRALQDAASIAERELKDPALAVRLRATGRTAIAAASGREAISAARAREAIPASRDAKAAAGVPKLKPAPRARDAQPASGERAAEPNASGAAAHVAQARKCQAAGDIDGAIEAYEQALNVEAELATVRQLADLFAQRAGTGDAQQAADLYCTLGELLGKPEGVAMLERALAQCPQHKAAQHVARYVHRQSRSPRNVARCSTRPARALPSKRRYKRRQRSSSGAVDRSAVLQAAGSGELCLAERRSRSLRCRRSHRSCSAKRSPKPSPERRPSALRRWVAIGGLLTAGSAAAAAFVVLAGPLR